MMNGRMNKRDFSQPGRSVSIVLVLVLVIPTWPSQNPEVAPFNSSAKTQRREDVKNPTRLRDRQTVASGANPYSLRLCAFASLREICAHLAFNFIGNRVIVIEESIEASITITSTRSATLCINRQSSFFHSSIPHSRFLILYSISKTPRLKPIAS